MGEDQLFSVITLNVRGIRNYKKRIKLYNWLFKHGGNNCVIYLQEAHCTPETKKQWQQQWQGQSHFSYGTSQSGGVITLIGKSLDFVEIRINCDNEGRLILLYCKINDHPILFVNNYAPTVEKEQIPFF